MTVFLRSLRVKSLISWLKDNIFEVKLFFAIGGVITFLFSALSIYANTVNMTYAVNKWYEQLPDEHWLKSDEEYGGPMYQFMNLYNCTSSFSRGAFDLAVISMGQEGDELGNFIEKSINYQEKRYRRKYKLKYDDGTPVIIHKIKIKQNDRLHVSLYYDDVKMLLDFDKEQFLDEITSNVKNNKISLANRIVYSYSDDTSIARINNGEIIGVSEGKTNIHFVCNSEEFVYTVTVK